MSALVATFTFLILFTRLKREESLDESNLFVLIEIYCDFLQFIQVYAGIDLKLTHDSFFQQFLHFIFHEPPYN
jgi:hypothetical protein